MAKITLDIPLSEVKKHIPKYVKNNRALQQQLMTEARGRNRLNKNRTVGMHKSDLEKALIADLQRKLTTMLPKMKKTLEGEINNLVTAKTLGWVKLNQNPGNRFVLVDRSGCVIQGFDSKDISKTDTVNRQLITATDFKAHAELPQVENNIPYMYADSEGHVTVGIGHKFENETEATFVPFYQELSGNQKNTNVSANDKRQAYKDIKTYWRNNPNSAAKAYENETNLRLEAVDIDRIYSADFIEHLGRAESALQDMDSYPLDAQIGILDLVYNSGSLGGYPKFTKAVMNRN